MCSSDLGVGLSRGDDDHLGGGLGAAGPVCDGRLVTQVDADVNVVGFVQTVIQEVDDGHLQVTVVEAPCPARGTGSRPRRRPGPR